jgi:adenosylcobinamide-GDP ribazoletransferase
LRSIFRALGFLSILPLGKLAHFETRDIPAMLAAFPLAGAILGACVGACWDGLVQVLPFDLTTALTICIWVLLTRAFHLDGLADCADGLGGSYTREGRLKIMKDPHTGAFGVVAIVCVLLVKYAALHGYTVTDIFQIRRIQLQGGDSIRRMLLISMVMSSARFGILAAACGANYARDPETGLGKDFIASAKLWVLLIGAIVPLALGAYAFERRGLMVVAAVFSTAMLLKLLFRRMLGGQTGDTLGATVEVCEIVALAMLVGNY